ncbi:hypothetical protein RFI_30941 [Reticulomyxa filosa]|uniref:Uncharacterized protein n=1 Tax=Reticulomyxa filosa TaxID=46433 RepID=X6LYN7_RETFI|nr:hypothetical protein RFI_30941 [Reticulomyxa filosa]|eukprot:ETO06451.1 hypothetical protein RFI_30941 [Reticulomyxa filosa]
MSLEGKPRDLNKQMVSLSAKGIKMLFTNFFEKFTIIIKRIQRRNQQRSGVTSKTRMSKKIYVYSSSGANKSKLKHHRRMTDKELIENLKAQQSNVCFVKFKQRLQQEQTLQNKTNLFNSHYQMHKKIGAMTNLNLGHVILRLLSMKTMSIFMFGFKEMVNKRIDEFLNVYKRQCKDGTGIAMLALNLEKDPSRIGEMIAEHNAFKGYNVALFNSKTISHEIDYVLEKIGAIG